ncbi:MAG TPA: hypothetical protein PKY38_14485, partial [Opitutaceae bacterium]|nr:hypothetical protein [Opitutaceae bacterium]
MSLFEIKAEIPADTVEAADGVLQELGVEGWSLLEDVIAKRAWVVGVFAAEPEDLHAAAALAHREAASD